MDLACYFGDVEMIQALVAAGAEVNVVNKLGERPADLLGRYEPIDDATRVACRSALGLPND
ncbi:MAG: ankyrin repeat domain-containing protein [Planctomycetota bacterium]